MLVVTVFPTAFLRAAASSWTVLWQSVLLLATVYDTVSALDAEAANVRIAESTIGAVLVLPTRTREADPEPDVGGRHGRHDGEARCFPAPCRPWAHGRVGVAARFLEFR